MGNRAVINFKDSKVGIYMHWNGGRESIEAFLRAAKTLGLREGDPTYGLARLTQIIGNFFGGSLSLGVGLLSELDCDNQDNGQYIIDDNFNIVGRKYHKHDGLVDQKVSEDIYQEVLVNNPQFNSG